MQAKTEQSEDTAKGPVVPSMTLASAVADRVEITDIRVLEMAASCKLSDPEGPPIQLRMEVSVKTNLQDGKAIEVLPRFAVLGVRAAESGKAAEDVLRIECRFRLHYTLSSAEGLTDEHVNSFGQLNGVYNAWPYWREFVQSTSVRMGLPPLTLAVYRLPPLEQEQQAGT